MDSNVLLEKSSLGQGLSEMKAKILRSEDGKRVNVLGDNMLIKLTGEDTQGQLTLIQEFNDPGVGIPLHVHDHEDEIFKVLEGELEVVVGDNKFVLKAGDLGFAPRNIPHSWKVVGDKKARVELSVFPAGLEEMFYTLGNLPAGPPDLALVKKICTKYGVRFV